MTLHRPFFLALFIIFCNSDLLSQEDLIYTKGFTKTLEYHNLEFFKPTEQWLRPTGLTEDEFFEYDMVLRSEDDYEMRIMIREEPKGIVRPPFVEVNRILASAATNELFGSIVVTSLDENYANVHYGSEWGIYADFYPKTTLAQGFKKGHLISFYTSGRALVTCLIFYNDRLDPYFRSAIRFVGRVN